MVKRNKSLPEPTQSTGILFHGGEVSACERLGGATTSSKQHIY